MSLKSACMLAFAFHVLLAAGTAHAMGRGKKSAARGAAAPLTYYSYTDPETGSPRNESATRLKLHLPPLDMGTEAVAHFDYELSCDNENDTKFPGLTLTLHHQGRELRVPLLRFNRSSEVIVGAAPQDALLDLDVEKSGEGSSCKLASLKPSIRTVETSASDDMALALRHAPWIGRRANLCDNDRSDLPIVLEYALNRSSDGGADLFYTVHFSDEDDTGFHGLGTYTVGHRMFIYGRRGDTEWIYQVHVDSKGNRVSTVYHTAERYIFGRNVGHVGKPFEGAFMPGTDHPMIWVYGDNNVFTDRSRPCRGVLRGHHPVPEPAIAGMPRDFVSLAKPWMARLSDIELLREGRAKVPSTEYLFATFNGFVPEDSVTPLFEVSAPRVAWSGDDIRLDTYMESAGMFALHIGRDILDAIERREAEGYVGFGGKNDSARFQASDFRFFRLVRQNGDFRTVELTSAFACMPDGINTLCRFSPSRAPASMPVPTLWGRFTRFLHQLSLL